MWRRRNGQVVFLQRMRDVAARVSDNAAFLEWLVWVEGEVALSDDTIATNLAERLAFLS